jgi:transketolase
MELFREQDEGYRGQILPPDVKKRVAVEAGSSFGWEKWVGDSGLVLSVNRFGSSASYNDNFEHYGFTVNNLVEKVKNLFKKQKK